MSDNARWENVGEIIAELFAPHHDVPGTTRREFELKKIARKLKESAGKSGATNLIYQRKQIAKMLKITTDQITAVAEAKPSLPTQGDIC